MNSLMAALARLEQAIGLARQSLTEDACAIASEEIKNFPAEVNVLHKAGVIRRLSGDDKAALDLFTRALAVHPNFHYTEIEIADLYAARGEKEEALRWYHKAIDSAPNYPVGYLRAAQLEKDLGRSWQGLRLLEKLHDYLPEHIEGNLLRADFFQYHGARSERARAYEAAISAGCNDLMVHLGYLEALTELGDYHAVLNHSTRHLPCHNSLWESHAAMRAGHAKLALAVDKDGLVAKAREREKSETWLATEHIYSRLEEAIRARRPLSLIRLGDGEARFLAFFDAKARKLISDQEAECILDLHWQNWFGEPLGSVAEVELRALAQSFRAALISADILGITTAARHEQDTIHRGYLGVLESVIDTLKIVHPEVTWIDALANIGLHGLSPFYGRLLSNLGFLGVISPHPGLGVRLARYHGVMSVDEYVVPGEGRLPEAARVRAIGRHFPDRYLELNSELKVPQQGAVFLVAAGLLGKIYCHRIRLLGGIAIDVGSVVDAWMGFATRPGQFEPLQQWTLPPHHDLNSKGP